MFNKTFIITPLMGGYAGTLKIRGEEGGYFAKEKTRMEVIKELINLAK